MNTQILKICPDDAPQLTLAASYIKDGCVVGMPTETVYGLAADAFNEKAVAKIFEAKGRPQDNPLIVHICDASQLDGLVSSVTENAKKLAKAFMPGPLTVILPKSASVPYCVTAGLETVAVRMPSHPVANAFIRACGVPLAAPSANLSGSPSPTTAQHVFNDLNGRIPLIIDGGECSVGVESTVVSLAGDVPELLRPGAVTPAMLREVIGELCINHAVLSQLNKGESPMSPGMKYKHYAPATHTVLVRGSVGKFTDYVTSLNKKSVAIVFDGEEAGMPFSCITYGKIDDYSSQEHRVFAALREADSFCAQVCCIRCPNECEDNLAVMNRLLRACAFEVIDLEEGGQNE